MNEKRYRVEEDDDGYSVKMDIPECSRYYSGERSDIVLVVNALNSAYESGLAVNEKYRLAWEELRQLQRQIGSRAANILSLDDIAARHGIREE